MRYYDWVFVLRLVLGDIWLFIPHSDIMKQEHNMVIELQTPGSGFTALNTRA